MRGPRRRWRRRDASALGRTPRLSVVVPVFNVEEYLCACLDSLLAQTLQDVEMVLVDDGSTDSSGQIATDYAKKHPRMRVIRTRNHGLGAARNTGVAHARGELLTFVDSDDLVPTRAFEVMVNTLDTSGSEFVVGSMQRLADDRLSTPPWLQAIHTRNRLAITVEDLPGILENVFAWNKVFRRSFWDRERLAFPEGVRYEDQVTTTRAYLTAATFDVIKAPVYHWRVRAERSSITQRRHELADLEDRMTTKRAALETVRQLGSGSVERTMLTKVLPGDLPQYFRHIPGCSEDYWQLLQQGVAELWGAECSLAESDLVAAQRLIGWLVGEDRRDDAESVLEFVEAHPVGPPLALRDGTLVTLLPMCDDPSGRVPPSLSRATDKDLRWDAWATDVVVENNRLHVSGIVRLRQLVDVSAEPAVQLVLRSTDGVEMEAQLSTKRPGDLSGSTPPAGIDRTDFDAVFDLSALLDASPGRTDGPTEWVAEVIWSVPGWQRRARFSRLQGYDLGLVSSIALSADVALEVIHDYRIGVRLHFMHRDDALHFMHRDDASGGEAAL